MEEEIERMMKVLDDASERRIKDFERIMDEYKYGAKAVAEKFRQSRVGKELYEEIRETS